MERAEPRTPVPTRWGLIPVVSAELVGLATAAGAAIAAELGLAHRRHHGFNMARSLARFERIDRWQQLAAMGAFVRASSSQLEPASGARDTGE